MKTKTLTLRQENVLGFIKDFISEAGYPPTLREISAHFGIKSPKNAGKHLDALEKKGLIKRSSGVSRAIEVIGSSFNDVIALPVVGRVRAGAAHPAVEDIIGHVALDTAFFKCRGAFILKVEGESMIGAGIDNGDYIVVRPESSATDNEIVVVSIDEETTVKRFFRIKDRIILKPENPAMLPMEVNAGEKDVRIVGRVISVIKRFDA